MIPPKFSLLLFFCSVYFRGIISISGGALFFFQRYFKRKDKEDEKRDAVKARESILTLKSVNAIGKLTYANALAIIGGKKNGLCCASHKPFYVVQVIM